MQKPRRYWLTLTASLWIVLAGMAMVLACISTPTLYDLVHPALCLDTNTPAALGADNSLPGVNRGIWRHSLQFLSGMALPAALEINLLASPSVFLQQLAQMQESPSSSFPPSTLPILQL